MRTARALARAAARCALQHPGAAAPPWAAAASALRPVPGIALARRLAAAAAAPPLPPHQVVPMPSLSPTMSEARREPGAAAHPRGPSP